MILPPPNDVDVAHAVRLLARFGAERARVVVRWPDGRGYVLCDVPGSGDPDAIIEVTGSRRQVAQVEAWSGGGVVDREGIADVAAVLVESAPPLDASSRLIFAIFTASQEAIGVTREGRHLLANQAMVALFRFPSLEEFLRSTTWDLVAPTHRQEVVDHARHRARGEPAPEDYLTRGLRYDGTEFDLGVRAFPYKMGGVVYTMLVLRDLTAEVAARRDLEESRALYRAMFEVNSAVKLLIDARTGEIVDANPAAVAFYGWDLDTLRKKQIQEINALPAEEVDREIANVREGRRRRASFQHHIANGEVRDVEVYSGPIAVEGREFLLSIVHDVTDRNELQQRLVQTQRMEALGRLAGGIAHDFNNLLAVILAYADGLQAALPGGTKPAADAAHIVKAALRAEELTQQLLALGRRQVLRPARLRLADVVRGLEGLLAATLATGSHLSIDIDDHVGWVWADQGQLDQVLLNLMANARDAMPRGGSVAIRVADADVTPGSPLAAEIGVGEWVSLAVTDSGIGMDAATRARVFEPFFTTKAGTGTGLGLATVYGIVQQSRGKVTVTSERDAGTTFTVWLPRVAPPNATPDVASPRERDARRRTILVVDDEPDLREFIRQRLEADGHAVIEAGDGFAAMQASQRHDGPIDLLVTDIVMPGMPGPELYRRIAEKRPGLRVLFVSGWSDGLDDAGLPANAGFVGKPFTGQALARAVDEILTA